MPNDNHAREQINRLIRRVAELEDNVRELKHGPPAWDREADRERDQLRADQLADLQARAESAEAGLQSAARLLSESDRRHSEADLVAKIQGRTLADLHARVGKVEEAIGPRLTETASRIDLQARVKVLEDRVIELLRTHDKAKGQPCQTSNGASSSEPSSAPSSVGSAGISSSPPPNGSPPREAGPASDPTATTTPPPSGGTTAAGGERWGCRIMRAKDGAWDVWSPSGRAYLGDDSNLSWWRTGHIDDEHGCFGSELEARAALSACTTPPPGWVEPTGKDRLQVGDSAVAAFVAAYDALMVEKSSHCSKNVAVQMRLKKQRLTHRWKALIAARAALETRP